MWGQILDYGWHLILPTVALSLTGFAGLQRLMRGQLLDVLRQDYIRTARAGRFAGRSSNLHSCFAEWLISWLRCWVLRQASLLSGAFIAKYFFNWSGLGSLTLEAVTNLDLYLVITSLMMGATMLIVGNLWADLLLKAVAQRIKREDLKQYT